MKPAIYTGFVTHKRYIPRIHAFKYPFFMWFLNLDHIERQADMGWWFSTKRFALSRYNRADYLGPPDEPLHISVKKRMQELTSEPVSGEIFGLLNLRTLGLYFSPVNFYFGYDESDNCTHMLAEVSNIPWNERHHYAHYLGNSQFSPSQTKAFKVSPFNPVDQRYTWTIEPPSRSVGVGIAVYDNRGHIFDARLKLQRHALTLSSVRRQLMRKPVMTASTVGGIYWQAFKLYLKGVPYVPYQKEMT
jgi:hypothetical protein